MPPPYTELIELLKAKGDFWSPWMVGEKGWLVGYTDDNSDRYSDQWEEWVTTADISWLPNLLVIANHPPLAESMTKWGGTTQEEWLWTVNDLIIAITKKDPVAVVDKLLEAMDADGEPSEFLFFFPHVAGGVRNAYHIPIGPDSETGVALINRLLDRLASLVKLIVEKPDEYVCNLCSVLYGISGHKQITEETAVAGEDGLRKRVHQLLEQIANATPPSRVKVYTLVNDCLHPPLTQDYRTTQ